MKLFNFLTSLFALLFAFMGNAMAALPTDFTTEVDTVKTDLGTIGGIILMVVLVIAGIKWLRRPVH